ncbi:uncharacterized protein LOC110228519, partial [Arabidopsis lyrata subsp. lyrata]|uniref:uncharacterized protein LOC110228519 n=1 Tax=Arabidopsis lyrata subsp. lyrata TaxID=81972 RepID=UPI000A29A74A
SKRPWLLWEIWKARNAVLYSARTPDHHFVIATALEEAEEWLQQNQQTSQEREWDSRNRSRAHRFWTKPAIGVLKCNLHSSWINEDSFCGGAWIIRTHTGDALFHARDAFLPFFNRIAAELHCILWTLQSLHDLHISSCEVWTDCAAAISGLENPHEWPKYRSVLGRILQVVRVMGEVSFKLSSPKANSLAREIACSVTRDGRLTSYLALGGPSWLQDRIDKDRRSIG